MRPSASALRRLVGVAALPVALVSTAAVVSVTSYSVFSATTSSPNNSFSAGSVVLKNDSSGSQAVSGSAVFTVTGITPTSAATVRCITVESSGSSASTVRLYAANAVQTNGLAGYLTLKVETGSASGGTAGGSCTNFSGGTVIGTTGPLSTFTSSATGYSSGVATGWSPTGGATETKAFRITVTPDSAMPNTAQNGTARVDLVWEADNT